ncbi:MAG: DUF3883 domain-containing protein [Gordonia amarae]
MSEVEACVADYLNMLTLEFNGQKYNKAERARALAARLDERTDKAVKYKWSNISAVMLELGYPPHPGYKPASNYQRILVDEVAKQLSDNAEVQLAVEAAVSRPAVAPSTESLVGDISWKQVDPPERTDRGEPITHEPQFRAVQRDYLAQEARNRSLGLAGETYVAEVEARRLWDAGKKTLSNKVEHVAQSSGDGLGFDVLSFELDGQDRLIEVKTTSFGKPTPFFVTRNELVRSKVDADRYHLYRLFDFRDDPKAFILSGHIEDHCHLDPATYLAKVV